MANDSIRISTQALKNTAEKMRSINTRLDEKLAEINKCMNSLQDTWQSDAAEDIRAAMNALKPRFDEYKGVVESYAKFLDTTALTYESTETSIQANANASTFK